MADIKVDPSKVRIVFGAALLMTGFLCPLFVPSVVDSELPAEWKTLFTALLLFGIPELFMFAAVAFLGKPGYSYLKGKLFSIIKKAAPVGAVSPFRYRIGLMMFLLPIIFGWLAPYMPEFIPNYQECHLQYSLIGDALLISSLFVLGGDFWDKLRALFIYDAKVRVSTPEVPDQGQKKRHHHTGGAD